MPIATVLTQEKDGKLPITLDYDLIYKGENDQKAEGLYFKDGKPYPEPFSTWEVRVNNNDELREYVKAHNNFSPDEYESGQNDPIHTHEVEGYQIICLTIPLKTKEIALELMKQWMIFLVALALDDEFKEANDYMIKHRDNDERNSKTAEEYLMLKNGWGVKCS